MNYEKFSLSDFPQLIELEQKYKISIGEPKLDDSQIAVLKDAIQSGRIEFFVAKEHGKIVAICSVSLVFSTFVCRLSGIFEDFYIADEYRRKGIARGLTQYVFEYLKSRGISSLWVGCADVDLEMYKSLGFTIPLGNLLTWSADE
ncbi:MAG: GNAT family N-acetyltransferase [Defluviitaleaceae bacterium]|nr:GNAT family N-acetyltransferase [Defluviitaleaceae bacterium]